MSDISGNGACMVKCNKVQRFKDSGPDVNLYILQYVVVTNRYGGDFNVVGVFVIIA